MADRYVVKGAAVVLPIEGGTERYLYRGAQVGDGFTVKGIKHALALGLIEKVKAPTAAEKSATEKAAADQAAAEKAAADKVAAETKQ
jgi:topoisomerase IA-like protein